MTRKPWKTYKLFPKANTQRLSHTNKMTIKTKVNSGKSSQIGASDEPKTGNIYNI